MSSKAILNKKHSSQQEATNLFGNEKDKSFTDSWQRGTKFDGSYVYNSIEEQAAASSLFCN